MEGVRYTQAFLTFGCKVPSSPLCRPSPDDEQGQNSAFHATVLLIGITTRAQEHLVAGLYGKGLDVMEVLHQVHNVVDTVLWVIFFKVQASLCD